MATMAINRQQDFSFFRRISDGLSQITKNLMGTTSLVSVQAATKNNDSLFGNFGVLASADKFKSNPKPVSKSSFLFSIEDAKNRLVDLVENKFKTDNFNELLGYLSSKFLKLETWKLAQGPINMLIDMKSNQAVPARSVHSSLSHDEMKKMKFETLKAQLRKDLDRILGSVEPVQAYSSWGGLAMDLANSRTNLGYIVSNEQAYIGKVYASGEDKRSLHEINEVAQKNGIELIFPTRDGMIDGERIAGLAVLEKARSVKGEELGFSHSALKRKFGNIGLVESIESELVSKRGRDSQFAVGEQSTQVADMSQFVKTSPDSFENSKEDRNVSSFGDFGNEIISEIPEEKRDLSVRSFGGDGFIIYDRDFNEETKIKFSDMPEGRYDRENEKGVVEGYTVISGTGELTHYNRKNQIIEIENKVEANLQEEYEGSAGPRFGM